MVGKKFEKNLGAMMDAELVDKFTSQVDNQGGKIKRSLAASVKLWIELPAEIQIQLLNQSLNANSLVNLVQEIVEERFEKGRNSALKLVELQRKKLNQKD